MPRYNVKGAAILCALKGMSHEAIDDRPLVRSLLIGSHWHAKVSLICQAIRSDRTQVGNLKVARVALCKPATAYTCFDIYGEETTAGHDNYLLWRNSKFTKLGRDQKDTSLWDYKDISIGRVHSDTITRHVLAYRVVTDADTCLELGCAGAHQSLDRMMEHGRGVEFLRQPPQLLWGDSQSLARVEIADPLGVRGGLSLVGPLAVRDGCQDAIEPGALVL